MRINGKMQKPLSVSHGFNHLIVNE